MIVLLTLTERERKALEKSWAKIFADEIFPAIDEERFSVLYSNKASRPNAPVNVIIGALIIKELFDYSDDEIVENLMLDLHLQYALHTTSFAEQPLSDKTLSRFRKRCYDYETLHGVDLYHDCVKDLSGKIAKDNETERTHTPYGFHDDRIKHSIFKSYGINLHLYIKTGYAI